MTPIPSRDILAVSCCAPSCLNLREGEGLNRQIQQSYQGHSGYLQATGLCANLVEAGLLVSHMESGRRGYDSLDFYKIVRPETLPFTPFPFELSLSQLKDAALATLEIQKRTLSCGMSLVDCNVYNIQFLGCRPVLIGNRSLRFPMASGDLGGCVPSV